MKPGNESRLFVAYYVYAIGLMFSMATMSVGVGILATVLLWCLFRNEYSNKTFFHPPGVIRTYWVWVVALFAIAVASLIQIRFFPLVVAGKAQLAPSYSLLTKFWYLFFLPFAWWGLGTLPVKSRERILVIWYLAALLISLVGIQQFFSGWPKAQEVPDGSLRYHATAFFKHHLSLASVIIFPFFWGLDHLAFQEKRNRLRERLQETYQFGGKFGGFSPSFFTLALVLGQISLFTVLVLSFSKMTWITLPLGLFLWGGIALRGAERKKIRRAWFIAGFLIVAAASTTEDFRLKVVQFVHGDSYKDRNDLWSANWNLFLQRPVLGVGFRQNSLLTSPYLIEKNPQKKGNVFNGHAHSNFLEMASSTGILGFGIFLGFQLFLLGILIFLARSSPEPFQGLQMSGPGILVAFVLLHLNGLTQVNFWEGKVLHNLMFVLAFSFREFSDLKSKAIYLVMDARMVEPRMHGIARYVRSVIEVFSERRVDQIYTRLAGVKVYPIFLVSRKLTPKQRQELFKEFKTIPCRSAFLSLAEWIEIPFRLTLLKADCFHSPSFMALPYCPVKHVSTVHDLIHLRFGSIFKKFYYLILLRPYLKRASAIFTVSHTVENQIQEWLDWKRDKQGQTIEEKHYFEKMEPRFHRSKKLYVTSNTIRRPSNTGTASVSGKAGGEIAKSRPYLLCLSNEKPHKNLKVLEDALKLLRTEGFDWDLRVSFDAKKGILSDCVPTEIDEKDIGTWIAHAKALVFPSLEEGFGLPPVEAAVQGTPIIVSDIPVHREVLGFLPATEVAWFNPQNAEALAGKIRTLWKHSGQNSVGKSDFSDQNPPDSRESIFKGPSQSSQSALLERYSVHRLGEQLDEAYRAVLVDN